ncbi:hypothetical protein ABFU82_18595 [Nocardioides sp. WV_118_6]|uniref:hypothetical protein n=1 Tax=Nocardioides simplex TaxID=2045 RepID=UPI0021502E44|nr:hypothetical protein [Pimelobacter simplex]UUW90696.1 hypothetical protein M0M43_04195 [Pimelobacter simplex]UUW94525.1 hypothetical protein M0M48_22700 [Pimelobacter simplex]
MSEHENLSDDQLLALLGRALADGAAVPQRRRDAARAAFTWRAVDAELAALLHDSALDAGAAVRSSDAGAAGPRTLSFEQAGLTLELEHDLAGGELLGEVVGEPGAVVRLERTDAAPVAVRADVSGFFRVEGVTLGPLRVVVERDDRVLTTPWVTL